MSLANRNKRFISPIKTLLEFSTVLKHFQSIHAHQAQKSYRGKRSIESDWDRFREFVQVHGGKTQTQMAHLWGDNVTQQNISDALRKLGLSRTKRPMTIENGMQRNAKPL